MSKIVTRCIPDVKYDPRYCFLQVKQSFGAVIPDKQNISFCSCCNIQLVWILPQVLGSQADTYSKENEEGKDAGFFHIIFLLRMRLLRISDPLGLEGLVHMFY